MANESSNPLKKIAFIAMPFGVKATQLNPEEGPSEIDFDALWFEAIKPAIEQMNYKPIRADEQSGSVIIKDMLQQLVSADLVVADISIPNGNVYYEAGVRHAAQPKGCILIAADWAQPLFDLKQITQLRYPFSKTAPSKANYESVKKHLTDSLPGLVDSEGPVYELTNHDTGSAILSKELREQQDSYFQFSVDLKKAVYQANDLNNVALRELAKNQSLQRLPHFAIKELVIAVRDHLNWHELLEVIARLPENLISDTFYLDMKAVALGKTGNIDEAIGLLEQLRDKNGETPVRLGTLGSWYRAYSRSARTSKFRRTYLSKAISSYRRGMELDLNGYYCSYKLLISLLIRKRTSDIREARSCATHTEAACQRAVVLGSLDEWLLPTQLVMAFYRKNAAQASQLLDKILDSGWADWKLIGLLVDLKTVLDLPPESTLVELDKIPNKKKRELIDLCKELQRDLPVKQSKLVKEFLPKLEQLGGTYKKIKPVQARKAVEGEIVVSITESGEETTNRAGVNDVVARNGTKAGEEYIVNMDTFLDRYFVNDEPDGTWKTYKPKGKVKALEVTQEVIAFLGVGSLFFIEAPWQADQYCEENDYLVSPYPELKEVYRIGNSEFKETYGLDE